MDIIDFFIIISMYGTALLTVRCVWLCVASSDTTHDEKGVAAYKTVELDDSLGGTPVQHRETQVGAGWRRKQRSGTC
eukprot:COSAG06_NODE_8059_length_2286_cov_1.889346_2_plen_77_part_00